MTRNLTSRRTVTLAEVTVEDGVKRGPWGGAIKKSFFVERGYKVYEQGNVIRNDFDVGSYYLPQEKYEELKSFDVRPGDILMTAAGTIGRVAVVPENAAPGVFNQALIRFRPDTRKVHPAFFVSQLRTIFSESETTKFSKGTALQNLMSIRGLRELPFTLPSLEEYALAGPHLPLSVHDVAGCRLHQEATDEQPQDDRPVRRDEDTTALEA